MIDVTKMNGGSITVNADLIETVEETPDTIVWLYAHTGEKYSGDGKVYKDNLSGI